MSWTNPYKLLGNGVDYYHDNISCEVLPGSTDSTGSIDNTDKVTIPPVISTLNSNTVDMLELMPIYNILKEEPTDTPLDNLVKEVTTSSNTTGSSDITGSSNIVLGYNSTFNPVSSSNIVLGYNSTFNSSNSIYAHTQRNEVQNSNAITHTYTATCSQPSEYQSSNSDSSTTSLDASYYTGVYVPLIASLLSE